MPRPMLFLLTLFFLAVAGCGQGSTARPGDTVEPVLLESPQWTAGKEGNLAIRLQATGKDNSGPRSLGFGGIPPSTNPQATITFYAGDNSQSPIEVALSHRC